MPRSTLLCFGLTVSALACGGDFRNDLFSAGGAGGASTGSMVTVSGSGSSSSATSTSTSSGVGSTAASSTSSSAASSSSGQGGGPGACSVGHPEGTCPDNENCFCGGPASGICACGKICQGTE